MKYQANPVIVDAYDIVDFGPLLSDGSRHLALRNGQNVVADAGMLSRFTPEAGDYWVKQEDGYVYLNPKQVFERKYSHVPDPGVIAGEQTYANPLPACCTLRDAYEILLRGRSGSRVSRSAWPPEKYLVMASHRPMWTLVDGASRSAWPDRIPTHHDQTNEDVNAADWQVRK